MGSGRYLGVNEYAVTRAVLGGRSHGDSELWGFWTQKNRQRGALRGTVINDDETAFSTSQTYRHFTIALSR